MLAKHINRRYLTDCFGVGIFVTRRDKFTEADNFITLGHKNRTTRLRETFTPKGRAATNTLRIRNGIRNPPPVSHAPYVEVNPGNLLCVGGICTAN